MVPSGRWKSPTETTPTSISKVLIEFNKSTSVKYWFPKPGKIKDICGEEDIKNLPGVIKYGFFRKIGDEQPEVKMHPDRFGFVITEGKDRDESIARVNNALSLLNIKVV